MVYRRGFVTRHQVTGWRFVMRRIASGVALHDTRMLVDPLRTQSRAVLMGVLILVTGLIGCFVFSLIRPGGSAGTNPVLADRATAALYVRVGDQLHPVLNLASARLIAGRPVNPTTVKSTELDKFPRGNLIGIPGPQNGWCKTLPRTRTGRCATPSAGSGTPHTAPVSRSSAGPEHQWGTGRRAGRRAGRARRQRRRHLAAVGRQAQPHRSGRPRRHQRVRPGYGCACRAADRAGFVQRDPGDAGADAAGHPGRGHPPHFPLPLPAPVGAVVVAYAADNSMLYYAILPDGLQPISPVLAAILRNTNSYGLDQPPRLGADQVARLPVSRILDTSRYPDQRISLVDAARAPVTCAYWSKPAGAATSSLTVLSGSSLPVPDTVRTVELVSAGVGGAAARVALTPGRGYFAQTVGQDASSPPAGSLFWIADTGVRYGIDTEPGPSGHAKAVEALGLSPPPVPIPWSVLSLFAPGPTLSRADALLAHDGLPPDSRRSRQASAQQETR
ncbi:type VII secretion protein EccB [Mycobacterium xenopi 4042]|uniref:Type VII secretion protein EccB n=1 Tax=Mycobacterium xenopi 4042 TaxID=1299334 RepID=X7Z9Q4_MYCXE|nr:type VII secretion protein EccB [Mycobacterium xenopi 4042]